MKTAVEWLVNEVGNYFKTPVFEKHFNSIIEQAKQKEEEQIREAYILGHYDSSLDIYNPSECYGEIKNQNK